MKKPERQKQPKIKKNRDRWQLSCRVAKKSTAEKLSPNLLYDEEFSDGSVMSYFMCQLDWTNGFQITGKNKKNNKTKEEENKQKTHSGWVRRRLEFESVH